MTTGGLRKPTGGTGTMAADGDGRGPGARPGTGPRAKHGPTTTVPVIPLWDRRQAEVHG